MLTGEKGRSGVSIENIKTKGLRGLRDNMVEYICKRIAEKRFAVPTSQAIGPADSSIDDDGAETQTAPQAAVAAQHQGSARVFAEGGNGGGGGDAAAGAERKEEESGSSESGSGSESESEEDEAVKQDEEDEGEEEEDKKDEEGVEEEVEYEVEYVDGTVEVGATEEAAGSADERNEEEEDGDAGNATRLAVGGKEKDEVGVEAVTEKGQEEAACEGSGKVPVHAGEGANITGVQETGEASGRQGPELDDVEELRRENWLLRAENARLAALLDEEKARLDRFFVGSFAELASAWLLDFDNPEGNMAYACAEAVSAVAEHVDTVVGDAKRGLEEYISNHLASAQVNIATASFKADILKAVTEATQLSFLASGMKFMTEMIGTMAPGRRGSSPSANDADHAQRREADKQGQNRTGGGDDAGSVERSKGADGSRRPDASPSANVADQAQRREADKQGQKRTGGGDGSVSVKRSKGADGSRDPGGSKPASQSVIDQLKTKVGWKVLRSSHSKGDGSGGAEGGTADEVATEVAAPEGPPLVAEQTHPQASGGKGSGANNEGPAIAAPPAPAAPSAAKGNAKAPAPKRDGPSAAKVPAGGNALKELLHRMETHRRDVQQPPVVDAGLAETARRSVTPHVAGTSSGAPLAAPQIASQPPADPKSAFLRAQLGARKAAAPPVTQPDAGKGATPTSVNAAPTPGAAVVDVAAEKGVRAALATGGRADRHADIAAIQAHFEAAKRPEHAPALAIMDTAYVVPSATHRGGTAEPTAATDAVAERNAGRKGKDDTGKGKAVSQRSTRAMSAGKEMSDEKGKKAGGNQDKKAGKGKSAKTKEEEVEAVGEGKKEHGRRGHDIRHDKSGDGLGWVGEIKVNGENRYIGKSRDNMELAYEHSIAYIVYDGYVSKVLMDELTVLKPGELEEWKGVWEEVKFLPTGMWTVMWARGLFDDILGRYRRYTGSGDALHDVLLPAIWFPVVENTKEGKEETEAFMSAMVNRVSMCAAYGKVAASAAFGKVEASAEGKAEERTEMVGADGEADEKTELAAQALAASTCTLWCFVGTGASVLGAVGEGKAASMVAGAGEKRAEDFKKVMHAVVDLARNREAPAEEVAHNVAPALQRQAVDSAFKEGVVGVEADIIARATVETLAFWGMCPVAGPKLKEHGIDVPCDAQMEYHMEHRGRKGEKVKQGKGSKRKKRQTGKQGKDSTDA
ncbi:unnamed protein product [Closterium sp. Yama58-4]|nr:unnamed protein product [Closterium sp. Yama58-4]